MSRRGVSLIAALALVVGACTGGGGGTSSPGASTTPPASSPTSSSPRPASPSATAGTSPSASASPTISGPAYDNPVFDRDFPDPHVLRVDDTYYAYATNYSTHHLPVLTSSDLATWEFVRDAMAILPEWARVGRTWAPGVIQIEDTFVVYFTAHHAESDRQCIGVAVAEEPTGPFEQTSDEPFICQLELGGSIDAYPFRDEDGTLYLYWKNDGNCCGFDVILWGQELSADGLTLVGEPVELLERDQAWERPLIENPAMVEHEDEYYLFYSGNRWDSADYAVGYGTCERPLGPCEKPLDEPIMTYELFATGPGGQSLFYDAEGNLWMAYHAWTGTDIGYPRGERSLRIDLVTFENGVPDVEGPTDEPQPLP
jgi:beta-xylosidase